MKRHIPFDLRLIALVLVLLLAGCGIRPYDYLSPCWKTFFSSDHVTPTANLMPTKAATQTPFLLLNQETTQSPVPSLLPQVITPTITPLNPPPQGTARVTLENRTGRTLYLSLQGEREWGFELAAAEVLAVDLPSGVYIYWIILPESRSLRGEKVIFSGPSNWTFYDTPGLLESPTPLWTIPP